MNRFAVSLFVTVALPLTSLSFVSCKKEEPPPPLPAAATVAEPTPELALEPVTPTTEPDTSTTPKKTGGVGKPSGNLQACCNALLQNAANAPEPNATYMKQAAATCGLLAGQGKDAGSVVATITRMMQGAGLPAACK